MQNQCVCCSLEGNQVCACRAGEQAKLSHKAGVVCNKTLVDPCPSFVRHKNPEHRRQTIMEHKVLLIKTFVIYQIHNARLDSIVTQLNHRWC